MNLLAKASSLSADPSELISFPTRGEGGFLVFEEDERPEAGQLALSSFF
jgi:hypothetical protein